MGDDGRSSQYSRWKELFDECEVDLAISENNHIYIRTNALYAKQETDSSRGWPVDEQLYNRDIIKFRGFYF